MSETFELINSKKKKKKQSLKSKGQQESLIPLILTLKPTDLTVIWYRERTETAPNYIIHNPR